MRIIESNEMSPAINKPPALPRELEKKTVEPVNKKEQDQEEPAIPVQYHFYSNPNSISPSLLEKETNDEPHFKPQGNILDEILIEPCHRSGIVATGPNRPYFLMTVTIIQIIVLIVELILNFTFTGSVIATDPFNYLIGPSVGTLIQMGGRVVPCMKSGTGYDGPNINIACPSVGIPSYQKLISGQNYTLCTLDAICGMGGVGNSPNQWWRFVVPIFMHGGIAHLAFNLVFQIKTGFELEKDIGSWRMGVIYMLTGIGSMVFSGIFTGSLSPTTGSSGALYGNNPIHIHVLTHVLYTGLVACCILDLVQNWKLSVNPWREFSFLIAEVIMLFLMGTLPFLDNYAHFGGFVVGVVCGFIFIPSLNFSKFDQMKKRFLFIVSVPVLIALIVFFFVAFYKLNIGQTCIWCKYINCIPGMPWCEEKWKTNLS